MTIENVRLRFQEWDGIEEKYTGYMVRVYGGDGIKGLNDFLYRFFKYTWFLDSEKSILKMDLGGFWEKFSQKERVSILDFGNEPISDEG